MLRLSLAVCSLASLTALAAFADEPTTATAASAEAPVLNTMCPVMPSNAVNPNISVEYQGKTILFCCGGCPAQFQADPDRYLSSLPQFASPEAEATN